MKNKQRLKIIIGETSMETKVYVGNKLIGFIQEIKIQISANGQIAVEITLPQTPKDKLITPITKVNPITKLMNKSIRLLRQCPNVKIKSLYDK